jgi:hypothetical protein
MITLDQVTALYSASAIGDYAEMNAILQSNPDPELLALPFVCRAILDCEKRIPVLLARLDAMREFLNLVNSKKYEIDTDPYWS